MPSKSTSQRRMQRVAHKKLEAVRTGVGSDMIIICHGLPFTVHRDLVCSQSPVIKDGVIDNFKGIGISIFKFREIEPAIAQSIIEFLYTKNYTLGPDQKTLLPDAFDKGSLPPLNTHHTTTLEGSEKKCFDSFLHHVLVHSAALKYDIPELEILSREKVTKSLDHNCPISVLPDLIAAAIEEKYDSALIHVFAARAARCMPKLALTPSFVARDWPGYFISLVFYAYATMQRQHEINSTSSPNSASETETENEAEIKEEDVKSSKTCRILDKSCHAQ